MEEFRAVSLLARHWRAFLADVLPGWTVKTFDTDADDPVLDPCLMVAGDGGNPPLYVSVFVDREARMAERAALRFRNFQIVVTPESPNPTEEHRTAIRAWETAMKRGG
jgi:hypothetical protein